MNTNALKKFAQEARTKLINQVGAKLEYVLTTDSAELREKTEQLKKLQEAINETSKEQVIDKVAYTWFNRLMALRFMDVNNYQPIGIRVVTPKEGFTLPELLDEAKQGHIPEELAVRHQRIYDLLDGKITGNQEENEAFKELLIGACNHLNKVFPFLFEKINDYAELLLPDDLTSEFSIVQDIREGMTAEDCKEVEIIGWLYQFYISEKKDQVFASKSKVSKEDIPAATQLFTPRWIVEYMVQNTVGKLWLQNKPNSKLKEHMPYYIDSPVANTDDYLKVNSVEEITLLDQACGSGHILVYGFELFTKIYEEEGYNPTEIPQLIIEKNLFGFEIDDRAAQLAGLALMMKARSSQRRLFRKELKPNILCYQDLKLTAEEIETTLKHIKLNASDELLHDLKNMQQATNLGSLILTHTTANEIEKSLREVTKEKSKTTDIFLKPQLLELQTALETLKYLATKYHCVVDNPPYMGGGNMNKPLADFVKTNYPSSKADLMACFIEAGLKALHLKGILGMINQHSWMFLSSYEKLREKLIKEITIDTLLHLGPRTFPEIGGEVVQNAAFTFINNSIDKEGVFFRLVVYDSSEIKKQNLLSAILDNNSREKYLIRQIQFFKIAGFRIGYWLSENIISAFNNSKRLGDVSDLKAGLQTGNNDRFVHFWWEINDNSISKDSNKRHVFYDKGGPKRKWFGNQWYVLDWKENGEFLKSNSNPVFRNSNFYFKEGLSYSLTNTNSIGFRYRNCLLYTSPSPRD